MAKVVLWLPQGRLGNLIFQCQALHFIFKSEFTVFTFKTIFNDVFKSPKNFHFIKIPLFHKGRIILKLNSFIRFLAKKGILGLVTPRLSLLHGQIMVEALDLEQKKGFLPVWVVDGWFQSDHFCVAKLEMQPHLGEKFDRRFLSVPVARRVAIHMRFGDYSSWNILGKVGVILPKSY